MANTYFKISFYLFYTFFLAVYSYFSQCSSCQQSFLTTAHKFVVLHQQTEKETVERARQTLLHFSSTHWRKGRVLIG